MENIQQNELLQSYSIPHILINKIPVKVFESCFMLVKEKCKLMPIISDSDIAKFVEIFRRDTFSIMFTTNKYLNSFYDFIDNYEFSQSRRYITYISCLSLYGEIRITNFKDQVLVYFVNILDRILIILPINYNHIMT